MATAKFETRSEFIRHFFKEKGTEIPFDEAMKILKSEGYEPVSSGLYLSLRRKHLKETGQASTPVQPMAAVTKQDHPKPVVTPAPGKNGHASKPQTDDLDILEALESRLDGLVQEADTLRNVGGISDLLRQARRKIGVAIEKKQTA